jgi:hypothetical protein
MVESPSQYRLYRYRDLGNAALAAACYRWTVSQTTRRVRAVRAAVAPNATEKRQPGGIKRIPNVPRLVLISGSRNILNDLGNNSEQAKKNASRILSYGKKNGSERVDGDRITKP